MASFEEELLMDEQESKREVAFIRKQLPQDTKEKFSDELLVWMLDTIAEHYFDTGLFDSDAEEVDIDMNEVAQHVCQQAEAEGRGPLDPQEVFFVVQADLDFQEQES